MRGRLVFRAMALAPVIAFAADPPQPALARIEASPGAAWLIDVEAGSILATNAAGAELLCLADDGGAPLLDASMPALGRLRALAALPRQQDSTSERLVIWGRAGAVRRRCRIDIDRAGPRVLALVAVLGDADPAEGPEEADRRQRRDSAARDAGDEAPPARVARALRASLAHELKTPVSAIAAAAEIMKDERFGPLGTERYAGYAADILGSAQHVLGVIDRMLADESAAAGADAAARQLVFAEIDAAEVLRATASQLAPLAERAGIALAVEIVPRLPRLVADATSLRQIVFNLATNALKFTDRGGRITIAGLYSGDGPLTIAVSDTGTGMTEEEVARLLAPDRAGRPGRQRGAPGSNGLGLGLPLVRALARANGAELVIESAPGRGTSARVVFAKERIVPV